MQFVSKQDWQVMTNARFRSQENGNIYANITSKKVTREEDLCSYLQKKSLLLFPLSFLTVVVFPDNHCSCRYILKY